MRKTTILHIQVIRDYEKLTERFPECRRPKPKAYLYIYRIYNTAKPLQFKSDFSREKDDYTSYASDTRLRKAYRASVEDPNQRHIKILMLWCTGDFLKAFYLELVQSPKTIIAYHRRSAFILLTLSLKEFRCITAYKKCANGKKPKTNTPNTSSFDIRFRILTNSMGLSWSQIVFTRGQVTWRQ